MRLKNIHTILFYILIFLLPWQTIWIIKETFLNNEKWQYGTIGIYAFDGIFLFWFLCNVFLYKKKIYSYIITNKKISILALLLCIWTLFSLSWSDNFEVGLYFWFKLTMCLCIFFLTQIQSYSLRHISKIFLVSMLFHSILGLYQFCTQNTFAYTLLGLQNHDVWHGSTATITTHAERWLRVYGGFPHPNIFGSFVIIALICNIYTHLATKKCSQKYHVFSYFVTALFMINLIFTFSRTAWVSGCITIILLSTIVFCKEKYTNKRKMSMHIIIMFCISIFCFITFLPIFSTRVHHTTPTHNSISDRKTYLIHAHHIVTHHTLTGVGVGNYTNTVAKTYNNIHPIWYYQPVHQSALLIFAEIGLIGSIFLWLFIFYACKNIFSYTQKYSLEKTVLATILCMFLLSSLFDHWLWTSHSGLIGFFVFCGLLAYQKTPA